MEYGQTARPSRSHAVAGHKDFMWQDSQKQLWGTCRRACLHCPASTMTKNGVGGQQYWGGWCIPVSWSWVKKAFFVLHPMHMLCTRLQSRRCRCNP